jgi:indole-3-glycerol phosphate synthase
VATYLDRIILWHRERAAADRRPLADLIERAQACPPARGMAQALSAPGLSVIAEVKRRSPSKGDLAPDLDPAQLAGAYERGGAAAISVLTDAEFFGGSPADLQAARGAVTVPVLRKDFTVSGNDLCDARLMGADAVLIIVAALDPSEVNALVHLAAQLGLDALVEVHDEGEARIALEASATLIGINQRDLRTFEVDTQRAARVARSLPPGVVRVAESGISGPGDLGPLADAGFDAILVGESLVRSADPEAGVRALRGAA